MHKHVGVGVAMLVVGLMIGTLTAPLGSLRAAAPPPVEQITIGGMDPLKLSEGILNLLLSKGLITKAEGQAVIDAAKRQPPKPPK